MNENTLEQQKNIPQNVEEAVESFTNKHDMELIIEYLRKNREDITEFCLQVSEAYKEGDNTGVMKLSQIIEKLL